MIAAQQFDVNNPRSVAGMIYLVVVGVCVFIIQPGIIQGFVNELGLTPEQAGYVASAEMWGLALMTVALTFFASRINWKKLTLIGLLIAIVGNLASTLDLSIEAFTAVRALTGVGLGTMISLPFAMLGMTTKKEFNFGSANVLVLVYGALGLFLIPTALANIGLDGIFVFLAIFCALGLLTIPSLPNGAEDNNAENEDGSDPYSSITKYMALGGVLLFDTAIGAVWAYIFLVGTQGGIGEQTVANILTFSQFLGILGSLLVVYLAGRVGRGGPFGAAIFFCAAGIGILLFEVNFLFYSAAIYIFNFWWNLVQPYIMATLSAFNDRSKTVIRGSCMQMLGFAIGPYIAASAIGDSLTPDYRIVNLLGTVLFLGSLVLFLPAILQQRKREALLQNSQ